MAQVGHIQLIGDSSSPPTSPPPIQSSVEVDMLAAEAESILPASAVSSTGTPSTEDIGRDLESAMDGVTSGDAAVGADEDDDDVQIVFSAPRRKKKRRKRIGSNHSITPLKDLKRDYDHAPKVTDHCPEDVPRRKSTGVVHQLEACHIGDAPSIFSRAGSLPSIPCTSTSAPRSQYPWFAEPNVSEGASELQSPSTWWDRSLLTSQPSRPVSTIAWRPLQEGCAGLNKRKHDDDIDGPWIQHALPRQSIELSPRTDPMSSGMLRLSPHSMNTLDTDMYPSTSFDSSMGTPWQSNGWINFGDRNYSQYTSFPPMKLSMQGDSSSSSKLYPGDWQPSSTNCLGPVTTTPWSQPNSHVPTTPCASPGNIVPRRAVQQADGIHGQLFQRSPSPAKFLPMKSMNPTLRSSPMTINDMRPYPSRANSSCQSTTQAEPIQVPISPTMSRNESRQTPTYDMLRKPSLYSIPAWPPSPTRIPTPMPSATSTLSGHLPVTPTNPLRQSTNELVQPSSTGALRHPSVMISSRPAPPTSYSRGARIVPAQASCPTTPQPPSQTRNTTSQFQIPSARGNRRHSPNLIVDIAETCQDVFPFAAVAGRHEVPIQKVFDTFSAIVQLPLLRNADDRRRHGSLGKRRTKEFRDAKKAMERAQEAERKTNGTQA